MKKTSLIFLQIFFLLFLSESLFSQTGQPDHSEGNQLLSPEGVFDKVRDRFGNKYDLASLNVNSSRPMGGPFSVTALPTSSCNAGYFTLWFIQGSYCDLNPIAKNLMCELFTNISGFIPSPLTSASLQVNILCADYTGTLQVAAIATPYFVFPNNPSNPNPGIIDNQAQKAIITGTDPYLNIPVTFNNANTFYHGAIYTATNAAWNLVTSASTITPGTVDFYSNHLHEAMHLLGILSLINYDGYSALGQFNNYFSTYDKFLVDKNGTPLITSSTASSCPNSNVAFTSSLVSAISTATSGCVTDISTCSTSIQYSSAAVNMTVYTPNCWEGGSSLSHLEDICTSNSVSASCYTANGNSNNNLYYVMANRTSTLGTCYVKRFLKEDERKILCDLGYSVSQTYTSNAVIDGTATTHSYVAGACSPTAVVFGLNDGLVNGAYVYTTTTTSTVITYSAILSNDSPNTASVSCLELVYNNATFTLGASDFTVSAAQNAGLVILKYYPKTAAGQFGNVTYIYIYFVPGNCNLAGMCNLVNNGGFESAFNCGPLVIGSSTLNADCWKLTQGSGNLYTNNCTNNSNKYNLGNNTVGTPLGTPLNSYSGSGNNTAIGLVWLDWPTATPGVIKNNLSSPVVPTHTYQLSLFANNYFYATPGNTYPVVISIASSSVYASTPSGSFPSGLDVLAEFTLNPGTNWSQLTHTFVFTPTVSVSHYALFVGINELKTLAIPGTSWNPSLSSQLGPDRGIFCFIDDVSIVEFPLPTFSIPNPTICGNQSFTNLAQYASTTGTFSGQGVTNSGGQQHFNLNLFMQPGVYPIAFTYSSTTNNCLNTIHQMVTIDNNSNYIVLSPANICLTNPTLNLNSLLTNTNITGTTYSLAGVQISSPYTFTAAGQYTLSASNTATTLCGIGIYTTVINVFSSVSPWFTDGGFTVNSASICAGDVATITAVSTSSLFTWQPGNMSNPIQLLSPTVTTIYTVSAFDNSLCVSNQTFAIIVFTNCCNGTSLTPFTGSAITSGTVFTGSLLISNDVTITSTQPISFQNCRVQFLNNAKLIVSNGAVLNVNGSHLYSCDNNMWGGIVVENGGGLNSATSNSQDNLIEDALTAIDVTNYTNTAVGNILNIHNTTFNKNYIDINIANYSVTPNPTGFIIDNCVFTCRDIPSTPNAWPSVGASSNTTGISAQLRTAIHGTTGLIPPYLAQTGFSVTTLKNPYSSQKSHIAIQLNSVGVSTTSGATGIIIGTTTANSFNLFDAHGIFISALNSNVTSLNNVFQNTQTYTVSGGSTFGGNAFYHSTSSLMNTALTLSATTSDAGNRFWDCHSGIQMLNTFEFKSEHSIFRSTQSNTAIISPTVLSVGEEAINVNTNRIGDYVIQNNEFTNVRDGLVIGINQGTFQIPGHSLTNPTYLKALSVVNNTFSPHLSTSFTGTNTNYIKNAISISDPMSDVWTPYYPNNTNGIVIQNNLLYRVYNGISLNGVNPHYSHYTTRRRVNDNIITLDEDPSGNLQTGIENANTQSWYDGGSSIQSIEQNSINLFGGNIANTNVTLLHSFNNNPQSSLEGYIICNTLTAAYQGFVFEGPNQNSYWRGNTMSNLSRGMSLVNAGIIGAQGSSVAPSDNKWNGSWSGNTALYVGNGSTAQNSPLYIKSGSPWTPTTYGGSGGSPSWYNASGGTLTATGAYTCGGSYGQKTVTVLLPHDEDYDSVELLYIAKAQFYTLLHYNDSLRNSDPLLQDFYDALQGTSIDKFTQIEEKLKGSYITEAEDVLNAFDQNSFNTVEVNYHAFYTLYIKYKNITLNTPFTSNDLANLSALADLCPGTNGSPVYQARALYQLVTGTVFNASTGCSSGDRFAHYNLQNQEAEQSWDVNLFPNPAQNLLSVIAKKECEILNITIRDISGRLIFEKDVKTLDRKAVLSLNLINGAYFITITNSNSERVVKTLLISK